jgi:hypothetical protein
MRLLSLLLIAATSYAQQIHTLAIGHEFRQDDSPTLAIAPDGSAWTAWLSFVGDRDDVVIRQYKNNKWGALQWVPGTSGDSWLPHVAIDRQNRVWVVWSQQANGNWDLYARRFDPAAQEWSTLERLTNDPQSDINPRIASDGNGRIAVVWQGFRNGQSDVFLKTLDGERWGSDVRVSQHATNEWEPALAFDRTGNIWIAYDSYRAGNYDVFLTKVSSGTSRGDEIAVSASPRFEARATVAVDTANRVWVAWEEGLAGWGKDQGYVIRDRKTGVPLGGVRRPRIRCFDAGQPRDTEDSLERAFTGAANTYQPHVFADPKGGVWVAAKSRRNIPDPTPVNPNRVTGFFEYGLTRFDGRSWSQAQILPNSRGRSSTRVSGGTLSDGTLLLVWPTDNRVEAFNHRPLRQQVFAAAVSAPLSSSNPQWRSQIEQPPGAADVTSHPNEAADVKAIRSYRTRIDGKELRIVRGDFHRHTELSWDGGGVADGNLQDFYRYMIDAAAMDFGASTDHQGGAWPYWWWYTQKMTDMYHVPGAYVPIFGYERSAIFPNGHRNIFFAKRSDSRVTPFHLRAGAEGFHVPAAPIGDEPGIGSGALVANDTKLLYEDIRSRNAIAISHTSGTRMGTDWRDNDPDLEPVVEIFQGARTNYEQLGAPFAAEEPKDAAHMKTAGYQPEGMVSNAWAKGYKLGIITSSDHGSTHISYAMVYTADPSRQGVLDAIRKRHTYGATDNIILEVRMGKHFMGDEFGLNKPEPIRVKVKGTAKVAKVEIIKDSKIIYATEPKTQDVSFEFTDRGDMNGRHYYYVRLQQEDQMIAWSSPFFINYQ